LREGAVPTVVQINNNENQKHVLCDVEKVFCKYAFNKQVFYMTVDEVVNNYDFSFPCKEHGSEILSHAIFYYVRLRMRQYTFQENQKMKKKSVIQRKLSKLNNM